MSWSKNIFDWLSNFSSHLRKKRGEDWLKSLSDYQRKLWTGFTRHTFKKVPKLPRIQSSQSFLKNVRDRSSGKDKKEKGKIKIPQVQTWLWSLDKSKSKQWIWGNGSKAFTFGELLLTLNCLTECYWLNILVLRSTKLQNWGRRLIHQKHFLFISAKKWNNFGLA